MIFMKMYNEYDDGVLFMLILLQENIVDSELSTARQVQVHSHHKLLK
jgi:hypothetical protein